MKDGGPAFPRPAGASAYDARPVDSNRSQKGMTLRDYFAAKAMQALCGTLDKTDVGYIGDGLLGGARISKAAYILADAMLAERDKP